jgi:hypothetical protein
VPERPLVLLENFTGQMQRILQKTAQFQALPRQMNQKLEGGKKRERENVNEPTSTWRLISHKGRNLSY